MIYFQTENPNLGIFGGSWVGKCWHFLPIWNILRPFWYILLQFGIVCGNLVYFSRFGMSGPRKIWQPCCTKISKKNFLAASYSM
jgi:hypothetical protein